MMRTGKTTPTIETAISQKISENVDCAVHNLKKYTHQVTLCISTKQTLAQIELTCSHGIQQDIQVLTLNHWYNQLSGLALEPLEAAYSLSGCESGSAAERVGHQTVFHCPLLFLYSPTKSIVYMC